LGRPEAGLIGVQYLRNDGGKHQGHYLVVGADAAPWAFRGTGLHNGSTFGHGGIEIDARSSASPRGTIVLAWMPNLQGPGYSPEMTYYSTRSGAKVFAAGTLNFAGTALEPTVRPLLENVWRQLARPRASEAQRDGRLSRPSRCGGSPGSGREGQLVLEPRQGFGL